jgi:tetratricopeptide (TPR) repeat protein
MTKPQDRITSIIKAAKIDQRQGRLNDALQKYVGIMNEQFANHEVKEDYTLGIVAHQLGSIHAINRDVKWARASFAKAREMLKDDPFGLAITLRDNENFELLLKNFDEAKKLIEMAFVELRKPEAGDNVTGRRLQTEVFVTEGFAHRITLFDERSSDQDVDEAINALQVIHIKLEDYAEEPQYTLANLQWIIKYIKDDELRAKYTQRAIELAEDLGNIQKRREYEMLLIGGIPLRNVYRSTSSTVRSIKSFGTSVLKDLVNKVR